MNPSFRCSRPHESILPRAHTDAHQRYRTYGPIRPMDEEPSGGLLWLAAGVAVLATGIGITCAVFA